MNPNRRTIRTGASVLETVTAIPHDLTGEPDLALEPAAMLRDLPHWDSIRQIEAIASGEEALGVDMHIRDMDRIFTVGDLVAALMRATPS